MISYDHLVSNRVKTNPTINKDKGNFYCWFWFSFALTQVVVSLYTRPNEEKGLEHINKEMCVQEFELFN